MKKEILIPILLVIAVVSIYAVTNLSSIGTQSVGQAGKWHHCNFGLNSAYCCEVTSDYLDVAFYDIFDTKAECEAGMVGGVCWPNENGDPAMPVTDSAYLCKNAYNPGTGGLYCEMGEIVSCLSGSCKNGVCTEVECQNGWTKCDGTRDRLKCENYQWADYTSCPTGQVCQDTYNHQTNCVCQPKTCSQLNAECGSVDNGCGSQIYCGPQTKSCTIVSLEDGSKSCLNNNKYSECCGWNCGQWTICIAGYRSRTCNWEGGSGTQCQVAPPLGASRTRTESEQCGCLPKDMPCGGPTDTDCCEGGCNLREDNTYKCGAVPPPQDCPITITGDWSAFWSSIDWPGIKDKCAPEGCQYLKPTGIVGANIREIKCCAGLIGEKQDNIPFSNFVSGGEYGLCKQESEFCQYFSFLKEALPENLQDLSCTIGMVGAFMLLLVLLRVVAGGR